MTRPDRIVGRVVRGLLDDGETLVASVVGYEEQGRRRRVVVLTDRRLIVTGLRGQPPVAFDPTATASSFERDEGRLVLGSSSTRLVVRDAEPAAARQIVALLADRRTLPEIATAPRIQHVHIVSDTTDP